MLWGDGGKAFEGAQRRHKLQIAAQVSGHHVDQFAVEAVEVVAEVGQIVGGLVPRQKRVDVAKRQGHVHQQGRLTRRLGQGYAQIRGYERAAVAALGRDHPQHRAARPRGGGWHAFRRLTTPQPEAVQVFFGQIGPDFANAQPHQSEDKVQVGLGRCQRDPRRFDVGA
ncbi:MAG: hypothetical protein EBS54_01155 [Betaproteobacteria bacterium]|nr:hypothetical protein [Betaproteobacteria bacterium]